MNVNPFVIPIPLNEAIVSDQKYNCFHRLSIAVKAERGMLTMFAFVCALLFIFIGLMPILAVGY